MPCFRVCFIADFESTVGTGDILALIGALGITPIDFILPCAMYVKVYKPRGLVLMVNIAIISLYTVVGIMGTISAIRGIVTGIH